MVLVLIIFSCSEITCGKFPLLTTASQMNPVVARDEIDEIKRPVPKA